MLPSSCISPMDAKKPVPRASCVPCGIEYPLHLTQEGCWSTSSTMVDEAPFQFDHLQDLSSISSKFCVPAMPVFYPVEAITQGHPSTLSNPDFQNAASSCDTADLVLLGCFGDHAPSLPDEVSCMHTGGGERQEVMSFNQHALKKKGVINSKKKHVSRKPKEAKGRWTAEEDGLLSRLVKEYGLRKWAKIAQFFKGRVGKQCRERWYNHLRPDIKKGIWTEEEDTVLIEAHSEIGNKWVEISKRLPGRTENAIKNRWNATMRHLLPGRRCTKSRPPVSGSSSTLLQIYINSIGALPKTNPPSTTPSPPPETSAASDLSYVNVGTKPWMERLEDGYYASKDMMFSDDAMAMLLESAFVEDTTCMGSMEYVGATDHGSLQENIVSGELTPATSSFPSNVY